MVILAHGLKNLKHKGVKTSIKSATQMSGLKALPHLHPQKKYKNG